MKPGRLHVLTDFHFQQRYPHHALARLAIEGGADTIQFRQKKGAIRQKLYEARLTAEVCKELNTPLIIDDHVDIALALNAQGVHLGKSDFPIQDARNVLKGNFLIGATANSIREALQIQKKNVDYIGFGPVYSSASKDNPGALQGLKALEEVCTVVDVPVIAISGIKVGRVEEVLNAGAYGVAVMTAISTASDPRRETELFRNELDRLT